MDVPFTWKLTGGWQFGWSAEFPLGVRCSHSATSARTWWRGAGRTARSTSCGATARTLWAYIGDGGTIVGECVDCAFLWHQPHGEPPAREMPDIFFSPSSIRDRSPAYRVPYDSAPYDSALYFSAPLDDRRERVEKEFRVTMWDDLEIWRSRSTTCLQAPETGADPSSGPIWAIPSRPSGRLGWPWTGRGRRPTLTGRCSSLGVGGTMREFRAFRRGHHAAGIRLLSGVALVTGWPGPVDDSPPAPRR